MLSECPVIRALIAPRNLDVQVSHHASDGSLEVPHGKLDAFVALGRGGQRDGGAGERERNPRAHGADPFPFLWPELVHPRLGAIEHKSPGPRLARDLDMGEDLLAGNSLGLGDPYLRVERVGHPLRQRAALDDEHVGGHVGGVRGDGHEVGVEVVERSIDRSELYIADELWFCGTGVQIAAITHIDHRPVGSGKMGPLVSDLRELYFDVVRGRVPKYRHWNTPVYVQEAAQPKAEEASAAD